MNFPCSLLLVVSLGRGGILLHNSLVLIFFKINSNTRETEFSKLSHVFLIQLKPCVQAGYTGGL